MNEQTPKDLLSRKDLLGFTRRTIAGDQVALRASSAKVTTKTQFKPSDDLDGADGERLSADRS